jgi:peroxiredoxin
MTDFRFSLKQSVVPTLFLLFFSQTFSITAQAIEPDSVSPNWSVAGSDGKTHQLSEYKGKTVVLEWFNFGCPYVKKHYESQNMQELQKFATKNPNLVWLSVVSSAEGKQGHFTTAAEAEAKKKELGSAATLLLLDKDGKLGHLYEAMTTPHMFILNGKGEVAYQGAIDSIPTPEKSDIAKATPYFKNALEAVLQGKAVAMKRTKAYGCSVKY